jgi:cell division protein FtsI/penicillin-binding protein 2
VVTAASFEVADMDATEPVGLSGGCSHVRESGEWLLGREAERRKDPAGEMSLRRAFGSSCNGFFAKIALSRLGLGAITTFARKLGWENGVPADFAVERSPFFPPTPENSSAHTVGSFAAGFGYVGLSAAHAAWLMATIGNEGVSKPLRLFRDTPEQAEPGERLLSAETAHKMLGVLDASVRSGTASFAYRRGKYKKYRDVVGGKTGTLTGNSPKGLTTWFAGLAPLDKPEVAVAAVVMLEDHWHIKGPLLAAEGLYDYFELKEGGKTAMKVDAHPSIQVVGAHAQTIDSSRQSPGF